MKAKITICHFDSAFIIVPLEKKGFALMAKASGTSIYGYVIQTIKGQPKPGFDPISCISALTSDCRVNMDEYDEQAQICLGTTYVTMSCELGLETALRLGLRVNDLRHSKAAA